jgi:glycerol-3-phosphate dehydrogenase subunit C
MTIKPDEPEKKARDVLEECADCDICRFLMDTDCQFFPELYRLYDKEHEGGETVTSEELRNLVDLCNFCALCPCPPVRANIIEAKTHFIDRDGLKFGVRTLEDVERMAKLCGTFPKLSKLLFGSKLGGDLFKKAAGIHPERRLPAFPENDFPQWVKKKGLKTRPDKVGTRKVAYFAGCTANYLVPAVPQAAAEVMRYNDIKVYYPDQKCCGMPSFLEGDRQLTLEFAQFNIERLAEFVAAGCDIVCSCPTCGFMLKNVLKEGAYYSREYQASVGEDDTYLKIPAAESPDPTGKMKFELLKRNMYQEILKDDGYFSAIDPMKRIGVAENSYDLGEYLENLHRSGELKTDFGSLSGRMVYYPPCHLREQNIGRPYQDLLDLVPGVDMVPIDGGFYCCGMAGIMGFKREFHETSLHLGNRLMEQIKKLNPDKLVTDCLSCRLQFKQMLSYDVFHPIEMINEAYANAKSDPCQSSSI